VAAAGIARIPAESIPFVGISILIAGTAYELYEACEGLEDLDKLHAEIGMSEQVPDDVVHSVCDPELPNAGEVWDGVVEMSGEWLEQTRGPYSRIIQQELDTPPAKTYLMSSQGLLMASGVNCWQC